jgi:hypothetical protein
MAISATLVKQTATTYIADITALDADTGPTSIAHGLVGTPLSLAITWNATAATTVIPNWAITATSTNIVLSKQNNVGSGGAAVIRVVAKLPHSIE